MIQQLARPMYDQRKWLLGKIHDVAKRLGMDDATRRDFQMELVGENSCRDMSHQQLKKVLYALTHRSGTELRAAAASKPMTPIGSLVEGAMGKAYVLHSKRHGRDERMPGEPVTIEQKKMIDALFTDIEVQNPGRLPATWRTAFCKRQCGRVWPQTRAQANKIIEALKAMRARGWHPKGRAAGAEASPAPDRRALDNRTDVGRSSTAAIERHPAPALEVGV